MKVTYHNGVKGIGSATHNSRNFDYEKLAKHIDPELVDQNIYISIYPEYSGKNANFTKAEEKFYKEHFTESLKRRNDNYIKHRHKEKVKTMKEFMSMPRYKPKETIIQIGDIDEHASPEQLKHLYNELYKYNRKLSKGHCQTLDVAIHLDEATPHMHVRQLWVYEKENEKGEKYFEIGREQAMKEAGIERPFPEEPESRYNNRNMTYTKLMREKAEEICREMGLDIDVERENRPHLSKIEYITEKTKEYKEKIKTKDDEFSMGYNPDELLI